jgi:hypothetical protein
MIAKIPKQGDGLRLRMDRQTDRQTREERREAMEMGLGAFDFLPPWQTLDWQLECGGINCV